MSSSKVPSKYIIPLNMNGLIGRMLKYPLKGSSNEILLVGDLRSSIEYWWGLSRALHDFGSVTIPDLPGIGGMDSFYKIGVRPSIDNYADYLAAFIKMRYKKKTFVCVGVGFGFVVITRLLQKHPSLKRNVKLLISLGGYADHDDFLLSRPRYYLALYLTAVFSRRLPAFALKHTAFSGRVVRRFCSRALPGSTPIEEKNQLLDVEVERWLSGDLRSYLAISNELAWFTNCDTQLELSVWNVGVHSGYLDWRRVEQHMRVVFLDYHYLVAGSKSNRYSLLRDKRSAAIFIPTGLKKQIRSAFVDS